MKSLSLLVVVAALAAPALGEAPQLFYHESVGIPEAARIKQAEQALDFDGNRIVGGAVAPLGTYPFLVTLHLIEPVHTHTNYLKNKKK